MTLSARTGIDSPDPVPLPRTNGANGANRTNGTNGTKRTNGKDANGTKDAKDANPNRVRQPLLSYLDVPLVILAMIPAVALGAPVLGCAIGAGGWILVRAIGETDRRWIRKVEEPRKQLGVSLFEAFGRIWLLAGVIIIAAAAGGRVDGLTAALVIFGAYSVAFLMKVITGPPRRKAVQ